MGIIGISYVRQPHFLYRCGEFMRGNGSDQIDKVMEDVYENNYVLIWSISEKFSPKLYLESPREVHSLQFSPNEGNILVGGLINGQVVVWDIGEHLQGRQEVSFTLETTTKFQRAIRAHLGWMKQKKPQSYILPSAISSLQFSHETCVTGIQWLSPFWHITETGEFEEIKGDSQSQEFMTCAGDGCVKFWNLKDWKLERTTVIRRRKTSTSSPHIRIKKSSVSVITSHFKVLTRSSDVVEHDKELEGLFTGVPLSVMAVDFVYMPHEKEKDSMKSIKELTSRKRKISKLPLPSSSEQKDSKSMKDDDSYNAAKQTEQLPSARKVPPKPEVTVGTLDGAVTKLIWNDFDSDTEEQTVGPQVGSFSFWGDVHDGPVTVLVYSPFIEDLLLSIGGNIFAIWKESAKQVLLYRRKCSVLLTCGSWSVHQPSMFYITRIDGKMELWDLLENSDKSTFHQRLSGKPLTGIYPHIHLSQSIIGVADINAQFRMLYVPGQHSKFVQNQIGKLLSLIRQEIHRKESFIIWQNKWEEKNADILRTRKEAAELAVKKEEEAEREKARKLKDQKKRKQQEIEARKMMLADIRAKTFTWKKDAEKKWSNEQEQYLIKTRLQQKKLDKEKLQHIQKPYISALEEEKNKKAKQTERLSQKHQIYRAAVNSAFPELSEVVKTTTSTLAADIMSEIEKEIMNAKPYEEVAKEALIFIKGHPFEFCFDWIRFMKEAHAREHRLQEFIIEGYHSFN